MIENLLSFRRFVAEIAATAIALGADSIESSAMAR